jgi:tetratricopeptide (TPR) repeat protein
MPRQGGSYQCKSMINRYYLNYLALVMCFVSHPAVFASDGITSDGSFAEEMKLGRKCTKPADAISHYDKAIVIDPGRADAFSNRAKAFEDLHEYRKALKDYNHAIYLDPSDSNLFLQRGYVYEETHQYALAIKDYDEAIKLSPDQGDYWFSRSMSKLKSGKYDDALPDLSKSIELKPTVGAYSYRALLHKMEGKHDLALRDLALAEQVPANGTIGPQSHVDPIPPVTDPYKDENGKTYPAPWGGLLSRQMLEQEYNALKLQKNFGYYDMNCFPKFEDKLSR